MMISLCYAYFQNPLMLAEQYRIWSGYPDEIKAQIEVVLVDAGGEDHSAIRVHRPYLGLPPLRIFRLLKHERWNQDVARNLAAAQAHGPWLLLTDMDHVVPSETLALCFAEKRERIIYTFGRVDAPDLMPKLKDGKEHRHPNSFLMSKALYWEIGGYDERLVGYYGTDGPYRTRASKKAHFYPLSAPLIRYPREVIEDAATNSLSRKGEENDAQRWRLSEAMQNPRKIQVLSREWEQLL